MTYSKLFYKVFVFFSPVTIEGVFTCLSWLLLTKMILFLFEIEGKTVLDMLFIPWCWDMALPVLKGIPLSSMIWIVEVKTELNVLTGFYWEHLFPELKSLCFRDFRSDSEWSPSSILLRWREKKKKKSLICCTIPLVVLIFSFSVWLISFLFGVLRCLPTSPACGSSNLSHSSRAGDDHRDLQGSLRSWAQHRRGQRHPTSEFLLK